MVSDVFIFLVSDMSQNSVKVLKPKLVKDLRTKDSPKLTSKISWRGKSQPGAASDAAMNTSHVSEANNNYKEIDEKETVKSEHLDLRDTDRTDSTKLASVSVIKLDNTETELMNKSIELLKKEEVPVDQVKKLFFTHFKQCSDPHWSCFKLSASSPDFRVGKARGVTWTVLNNFKLFKEASKDLNDSDTDVKDQVFQKFTRQPNSMILKLALNIFKLDQVNTCF